MRSIFPLFRVDNPLAVRAQQAYAARFPVWVRRLDVLGVVVGAILLCAALVFTWALRPTDTYPAAVYRELAFDLAAFLQTAVGIVYALVLLRGLAAGVGVAQHTQDVRLPGLSPQRRIAGQWLAALTEVRGWLVALGLVRITAIALMAAEFRLRLVRDVLTNTAYGSRDTTWLLPLILAAAIGLVGLEGWATTGLGLLLGTWLRGARRAWVAAVGIRALPVLIFSWLPTRINALGTPFFLETVRWYDYPGFAFVDGGTSALLRLAMPVYYVPRTAEHFVTVGLLGVAAAVLMLLLYGGLAYALTRATWTSQRGTPALEPDRPLSGSSLPPIQN